MRGSKFPEATRSLRPPAGMNEDQCLPLWVWQGDVAGAPVVISRWELDDDDRARIAACGPVWLHIWGNTMPPAALTTEHPFKPAEEPPPRKGASVRVVGCAEPSCMRNFIVFTAQREDWEPKSCPFCGSPKIDVGAKP